MSRAQLRRLAPPICSVKLCNWVYWLSQRKHYLVTRSFRSLKKIFLTQSVGKSSTYIFLFFIDLWTKNKEYKGLQCQKRKIQGKLKSTLTLKFQGVSSPLFGLDAYQAKLFLQQDFLKKILMHAKKKSRSLSESSHARSILLPIHASYICIYVLPPF